MLIILCVGIIQIQELKKNFPDVAFAPMIQGTIQRPFMQVSKAKKCMVKNRTYMCMEGPFFTKDF